MTGDSPVPVWRRVVLAGSIGLLALTAWLVLWQFGPAFHGPVHHHHADAGWASGLVFIGSWTVMTIAMMLPTSIPLIATFHTIAGQRPDRSFLVALVVAGYVTIWALVGVLFYAVGVVVQSVPWWRTHAASGGAMMVIAAGAYQFTALKYRCLDRCRSPLSFVLSYWQGQHDRPNAIRLGLHHGLFCVGCCWALMLLMFAVGVGNLGWMLVLGAAMAIEKNVSWGRALSTPLGVVLLVGGLILVARG